MKEQPDRRTFLHMAGVGAAGVAALGAGVALEGCSSTAPSVPSTPELVPIETSADPKPASDKTIQLNSGVFTLLDFGDTTEYNFATRGLISAPDALEIKDEEGTVVWSQKAFAFLGTVDDQAEVPDTANPSLWRNAHHNSGLTKNRSRLPPDGEAGPMASR